MKARSSWIMVLVPLMITLAWLGCGGDSSNGGDDGDFSIDTYPALTNTSPFLFRGQKPAGHAVHVDGTVQVPASETAVWDLSLDLEEGDNTFTFESVDAEGATFKSETVDIALDSIAPTVVARVPAPDETDVAINTSVSVTLSEVLNCDTVTSDVFMIQGVGATIGCSPGSPTISLTPDANLAQNTAYTVSLFSDVADMAGNTLAADVGWQFTTGSTIDETPPDPPTIDNPAPPRYTVLDGATVGGWKESGSSVISNGNVIVSKDVLDSWSYRFPFAMGDNTFSLTSEDSAGNVSVTSTDFTVTRTSGEFTIDP